MEKGEHSFKTFTHQRTVYVHIFCPIFQKTPLNEIFTPKQWCALVPPGKVFVWIFCAAPPPSSPHSLLQSHSSFPTSNSVATSTWKQLNSTAINVSSHVFNSLFLPCYKLLPTAILFWGCFQIYICISTIIIHQHILMVHQTSFMML